MLRLRPIVAADETAIAAWPPYPAEFAEIDYALHKDGWLAEFRDRPDTRRYAAEWAGDLVGFSILAATAAGEAEFRIALRPNMAGCGLGTAIAIRTLEAGFAEIGLTRIQLVVRKHNPRAIRLYERLGFIRHGERRMTVNHQPVQFLEMELWRQNWPPQAG